MQIKPILGYAVIKEVKKDTMMFCDIDNQFTIVDICEIIEKPKAVYLQKGDTVVVLSTAPREPVVIDGEQMFIVSNEDIVGIIENGK